MDQSIKGQSLIKGILRELAVQGVPIYYSTDRGTQQCRIILDSDAGRSTAQIGTFALEGLDEPACSGRISFEIDAIQYEASISLNEELPSAFSFPSELVPKQRRSQRRLRPGTLSRDLMLVEVRGNSWRAYGTLKDSNRTHLVVRISNETPAIQISEPVHIWVFGRDVQTMEVEGKITFLRATSPDEQEMVIDIDTKTADPTRRRSPRAQTSVAAQILVVWPDQDGLNLQLNIQNHGLTGFAAKTVAAEPELPPLGAICRIPQIGIVARLAWISENSIGFDLRMNSAIGLSRWHDFTSRLNAQTLQSVPKARQMQRLLSIMFRSGYLRGKKAQAFAESPELVPSLSNSEQSKLWLRRYTASISSETDAHVAFSRITDTSWMIQEIAHCAPHGGVGESLIRDALLDFYTKEIPHASINSVLITLFDMASKFNREFWLPRAPLAQAEFRSAIVVELTPFHNRSFLAYNDRKLILEMPNLESWRQTFMRLRESFSEPALSSIGLRYDAFDCPNLRQNVLSSGYLFHRSCVFLRKNGKYVGAAVSFGLPTLANLTATANHIWLLLEDLEILPEVLQELRENSFTRSMLLGATQAVVVLANAQEIDGSNVKVSADFGARIFGLLAIPVMNLPRLVGVVEDEDGGKPA